MGAQPKRHLGHNPLGGVAVFLLLGMTAMVVISGLFSSHDGFAGPFAGLWGLELSDVHELAFRVLQALVAVHLLGVAVESWKAHDALAPAMVTGAKTRRADEPGQHARKAGVIALAAALLIGTATFIALAAAPAGVSAEGVGEDHGRDRGDRHREAD